VATNITKLKIILFFEQVKKKIRVNYKVLKAFLPKKMSLSSQKKGFGIRIRDPGKTYSGSWIQGSNRHRIPDPDPQHWVSGQDSLRLNTSTP
jgi:hypothetical protein